MAYIIFTSGSTSVPKAVMLPQFGLVRDSIANAEVNLKIHDEVGCIAVPFFHIFALISTFNLLNNGSPAIIISNFKVDTIVDLAYRYKANRLTTVGTLHARIIEHPDFKYKLSKQITGLTGGGAGLTQTQFLRIESAYENAYFINGYGQTEASGLIAIACSDDSADQRAKATGRIYPTKDVQIMDADGNILGYNTIGEVVIKNEGNLCKGYYGLPPEEQPFDKNGYMHTGDVGRIDEEGFLYLAGRLKNNIIRGGENISPVEVEQGLT